jgi:transposase
MKPLSNDLRERILAAVDHREGSRRDLAVRFGVNVSTITRLLQLRRQTGSFDPGPHAGGKQPTLDQDGPDRLRKLVQDTPDATLEQHRQGLGVSGSLMIVWRGLKKLDITREKKAWLMRGSWCEAALQALLSGGIFGAGLVGSISTRRRPWTSRSPTSWTRTPARPSWSSGSIPTGSPAPDAAVTTACPSTDGAGPRSWTSAAATAAGSSMPSPAPRCTGPSGGPPSWS